MASTTAAYSKRRPMNFRQKPISMAVLLDWYYKTAFLSDKTSAISPTAFGESVSDANLLRTSLKLISMATALFMTETKLEKTLA